ncbi:hypothetical protein RRG08_044292 [Elysia crispata]|uniref:Uncharacterized protein n=1 Tax=Elysia crispata TaxID=231223 RepID=A0AAE0XXH3_9GAST|nr:hypothetical protein RRG08_044292 [Elysia crispata]
MRRHYIPPECYLHEPTTGYIPIPNDTQLRPLAAMTGRKSANDSIRRPLVSAQKTPLGNMAAEQEKMMVETHAIYTELL